MRHTQPLNAEEQRVDAAMRNQHRTHAECDEALQWYRLSCAAASRALATERLEKVADLLTGMQA